MNDFTIEELDNIHNGLGWLMEACPSDAVESLRSRIFDMIDNYCEHEPRGEQEIFVDICDKCKEVLLRDE